MADDQDTTDPPRREDPRPAQTRELVLQAARMILVSEGQAAVTPTRLVEMSGVARSTIYRHWPDAAAIIADAMSLDRQDAMLHSSGDPGRDLRTYLGQLREVLESPAGAIIVAQAEVAERDDQAARTLAGNGRYRNELIQELLQDPRTDFDIPHAQLVGPLFMQRFFIRKPITDALITSVVEAYLASRPQAQAEHKSIPPAR